MSSVPLWVPIGAALLSTFMSLLSVLTAVRGIRLNAGIHYDRSHQELAREERQADAALAARRGKLYESVVLPAVREHLNAFMPTTLPVLVPALDNLAQIRHGSRPAVNAAGDSLEQALQDAWSELKYSLDYAVDATGDAALKTNVTAIYFTLEQDVSAVIKRWSSSAEDYMLTRDSFRPAFAKYSAALYNAAVEHDPELLHRKNAALPSSVPQIPEARPGFFGLIPPKKSQVLLPLASPPRDVGQE